MKCAQSCTKITGQVFRVTVVMPPVRWLTCKRATQLDCQAGVKKEIERLEWELKPKLSRNGRQSGHP
ncbi:hypothetical protein MJK70_20330 [Klebsiella pneumoniae]|nr:hypothetical protein MJK70_20330 [Klebsiella pneumoniae]